MLFFVILFIVIPPIIVISTMIKASKKNKSNSDKGNNQEIKSTKYETSYNPHSNNNGEGYEKTKISTLPKLDTTIVHSDEHSHPVFASEYKVERNIYTENSMNSEEEQGCEELKDIRVISISEEEQPKTNISNSEFKKMIIYSEILGAPRCKKIGKR